VEREAEAREAVMAGVALVAVMVVEGKAVVMAAVGWAVDWGVEAKVEVAREVEVTEVALVEVLEAAKAAAMVEETVAAKVAV
jgi:hypothetical protein